MSEALKNANLPATVVKRVRDWAWDEFNFGEWQDTAEIAKFMREELGYRASTPGQYAARFVAFGVENRDFETRMNGRQWRWIVHPAALLRIAANR